MGRGKRECYDKYKELKEAQKTKNELKKTMTRAAEASAPPEGPAPAPLLSRAGAAWFASIGPGMGFFGSVGCAALLRAGAILDDPGWSWPPRPD